MPEAEATQQTAEEGRPLSGLIHHARPLTQVIEFGTFRDPEQALIEAELVAKAFARRAAGLNLFKQIGDSKHLKIEGWQMLAMMYRVTAGVVDTRYVEVGEYTGYEATAEALLIRGADLPPIRISTAQAMCLNDEERWDVRPEYDWIRPEGGGEKVKTLVGEVAVPLQQLRSMAQTRACSKVLSNLLKFVAVMAGYAGTPAEEMTGRESGPDRPQRQAPQRSGKAAPTDPISEPQCNRLWAIAKNAAKSDDAVGVILEHFKYPTNVEGGVRKASESIMRKDYDAIVAEVMKP
jgi:hypothetical protein